MQIDTSMAAKEISSSVESAKLRKACGDFESLFIYTLLKNGRDSMPKGGMLGNSNESKIFTSMLDQTLAEQSSKGVGLGIGEMLYRQLGAQPASKGSNLETTF
ncbi:MAG: rod-binding protein [Desulfatibacillum sp.]|nr:rod-binding protein [Desulfatibacillum sp.]